MTQSSGTYIQRFRLWLTEPAYPHIISLFRIIFGMLMVYVIMGYFRIGLIKNMFVLPAINFQYDFFKWVKPLPEVWLNGILVLILICAIGITLGVFFKWACRIFAAGYLYIFLLDKSIYNNHIYLFILIAFLLSLTDADKYLSMKGKPNNAFRVPYWQQFIFQFQVVIVYFYGGLAKLRYDWLVECQPMRTLIANISNEHLLALLIKNDFGVYLFNYGGILIDLGAPFMLWNKRLRNWAIYPILIFHIINSMIFQDIGVFPYVMIACLILFYDTNELPVIKNLLNKGSSKKLVMKNSIRHKKPFVFSRTMPFLFLVIYAAFQLLFPLRGYLLPNNMDWTTIGNRFSWRMKVDTRQINEMEFFVVDKNKNQSPPIEFEKLVNDMQILNMSMDPRSVKDFASMLKVKASTANMGDVEVRAKIKVGYNGRSPQLFVNPEKDLATVPSNPFKLLDWVYPLQQ